MLQGINREYHSFQQSALRQYLTPIEEVVSGEICDRICKIIIKRKPFQKKKKYKMTVNDNGQNEGW